MRIGGGGVLSSFTEPSEGVAQRAGALYRAGIEDCYRQINIDPGKARELAFHVLGNCDPITIQALWDGLLCGSFSLESLVNKQSRVCGAVFNKGDVVYHCHTCETDPTCAICSECFQNGNHEGHVFRMVWTGGGCCDCGDPDAWAQEGFCCNHPGPPQGDEDPLDTIAPLVRERMETALLVVFCTLSQFVDKLAEQRETKAFKSMKARVIATLTWLVKLSDKGDSVRAVIRSVFADSRKLHTVGGKSVLAQFVDQQIGFPEDFRSATHTLYYRLLTDFKFKEYFAECFVHSYVKNASATPLPPSRLNTEDAETCPTSILNSYSVQLFTVPPLALDVVKRHNAMGAVLKALASELKSCVDADGIETLDVAAPSMKETTYFRFFVDLDYLFDNALVSSYFALDSSQADNLMAFLRILVLAQGMNRTTRETKEHVLFENQIISRASVALRVEDIALRCAAVLLARVMPLSSRKELSEGSKTLSDLPTESNIQTFLHRVVSVWATVVERQCLHIPDSSPLKTLCLSAGLPLSAVEATGVEWLPVSLHLTLHRMLALSLRRAWLAYGRDFSHLLWSASSTGLDPVSFFCRALEPILKIQVVGAQVRSGLWVRNGYVLERLFQFYPSDANQFCNDLALLQSLVVGLAALDSNSSPEGSDVHSGSQNAFDVFCSFALARFGLASFAFARSDAATDVPVDDRRDSNPSIKDLREQLATCLRLFIVVATDTTLTCKDPYLPVRQAVIHALAAAGDSPFSDIRSRVTLSHAFTTSQEDINKFVTRALEEVASFRPPEGMTEGTYRLKDQCWAEVSRYYSYYSLQDTQQAEQHYSEHLRSLNKSAGMLLSGRAAEAAIGFHARQAPFHSLLNIPHSLILFRAIFCFLWKRVERDVAAQEDEALAASLHLLLLGLHHPEERQEGNFAKRLRTKQAPPPPVAELEPGHFKTAIQDIQDGSSVLQLLWTLSSRSENHDFRPCILDIFAACEHDRACKQLLEDLQDSREDGEPLDRASRKKLMLEKQKSILQQFEAQQKSFLEKTGYQAVEKAFEGTDESGRVQAYCALCREGEVGHASAETGGDEEYKTSSGTDMLCALVYIQRYTVDLHRYLCTTERLSGGRTAVLAAIDDNEVEVAQTIADERDVIVVDAKRIQRSTVFIRDRASKNSAGALLWVHVKTLFPQWMGDRARLADAEKCLVMRPCRHYMHYSCAERMRGVGQLREFQCPVCRGTVNSLLPVVGSICSLAGEHSPQALSPDAMDFSDVNLELELPELSESIADQFYIFSKREPPEFRFEYESQNNPWPLPSILAELAASTIAATEIAMRSGRPCERLSPEGKEWPMRYPLAPPNDDVLAEFAAFRGSFSAIRSLMMSLVSEEEEEEEEGNPWDGFAHRSLFLDACARFLETDARTGVGASDPFYVLVLAALCCPVPPTGVFFDALSRFTVSSQVARVVELARKKSRTFSCDLQNCTDSDVFASLDEIGMTSHVLPTLRKVVMLRCILFNEPLPAFLSEEIIESMSDQLSRLCEYQGWNSNSVTSEIPFKRWQNSLRNVSNAESVSLPFEVQPCVHGFVRPALISLPVEYTDLLRLFEKEICCSCGCACPAGKAVLCLVCGSVFCAQHRVRDPPEVEVMTHALTCGLGGCVFLRVKKSDVLVTLDRMMVTYHSPYLDEHGEADVGLRRGRPLYLNEERYRRLNSLWLLHTFLQNSQIIRARQRQHGLWAP